MPKNKKIHPKKAMLGRFCHSFAFRLDSVNWINSEHNYSYRIQLICYLLNSICLLWMMMMMIGIEFIHNGGTHSFILNVRAQIYSCGHILFTQRFVSCFFFLLCFRWDLNTYSHFNLFHFACISIQQKCHAIANTMCSMITAHRYIYIGSFEYISADKNRLNLNQNTIIKIKMQMKICSADIIYAMRIENFEPPTNS